MTGYEVISRFVFDAPTVWAHKITAQVFGFYSIMAGGYVLLNKAHIRVDVFFNRLSSKGKAIADLCTFTFAFLFVGALLFRASSFAWESIKLMEHTYPPFPLLTFPLKSSMILGISLLLLQLIAKYIRDLYLAITGLEHV